MEPDVVVRQETPLIGRGWGSLLGCTSRTALSGGAEHLEVSGTNDIAEHGQAGVLEVGALDVGAVRQHEGH